MARPPSLGVLEGRLQGRSFAEPNKAIADGELPYWVPIKSIVVQVDVPDPGTTAPPRRSPGAPDTSQLADHRSR
jgi:hypothetical protein